MAFENLDDAFIEGTLNLIDNQVDPQTGMIKLRAIFSNEDRLLWPGKFVKTRLILKIEENALLIPFQAIQITSEGTQVFVVKEDSTVEARSVTLGQREKLDIIIDKGLKEGEKVVTEGQLNLSDGSKIFIKEDKTL